jgi:hypothetical protein
MRKLSSELSSDRLSSARIKLPSGVKAVGVYPKEQTGDNQSIGLQLDRHEAIKLATMILATSLDHELIDITGYYDTGQVTVTFEPRKNQSYVTATNVIKG